MRVQVNLNDVLVKKLDKYAETIGISRSALCAYLIGQGALGIDKAIESMDKFVEMASKNVDIKGQMDIGEIINQ